MEAIIIVTAGAIAGVAAIAKFISSRRRKNKEPELDSCPSVIFQGYNPTPDPEPAPVAAAEEQAPEAKKKNATPGKDAKVIAEILKPMRTVQNQAAFVLVVRALTGYKDWTVKEYHRGHNLVTADHIESTATWFIQAGLFSTPEECVVAAAQRLLFKHH